MNVKLLSNPSSKEILSTLDLVFIDKVEFVLIIAPFKESYCLARATLEVANKLKLPLKVCVMWPNGSIDGAGRTEAALTPWKSFEEVVEVKRSSDSPSWWDICQMTDRGAILVRPDEHVAWRTKSRIADPIMTMKSVFHIVTGVDCI
uniref:Putative ovule protein n=1 Tax=Solanum chacoense TaxID=4108 RepID=A0A0V0H6M6_SOLCH